MLKFDASKYPPPPSEIAAYQVTDPTICRSECRISDLWVFGYLNLLSNLLCGGGATMLYFFRPMLLHYNVYQADNRGHARSKAILIRYQKGLTKECTSQNVLEDNNDRCTLS